MAKKWKDYDYYTLMTCPYKIHDRSLNECSPLFIIEPVMIEILPHSVEVEDEISFFFF